MTKEGQASQSSWAESINSPDPTRAAVLPRRSVLRALVGAGAAPLILPARAWGKQVKPPSDTLHLAVLGVGGQGSGHAMTWAALPGTRMVAVCDVNRQHAEKCKQRVDERQGDSDCAIYHDFREVVARPDIDAVSIAVPDHWHVLLALAAVRAGKHVYLEKPLSYTVEEGQWLVAESRRHGVVLQQGTQQRSMLNFQRATWLAQAGHLGQVHTAVATSPYGKEGGEPKPAAVPPEIDYDFWLGPAPFNPYTPGRCRGHGGVGWYHIRDYSGGWITAWGSHHVDSAQAALGKDHEAPVSVEAWGAFPESGVYDVAYRWRAEYRYADGKRLVFATPEEGAGKGDIDIQGDEGWVAASRGSIDAHPKKLLDLRPPPMAQPWPTHHFLDFTNAIREGRDGCAPVEVGHLSTTLCHLTTIALTLQRPLRWDGANERFVDDPTADRMLSSPMRPPWSLEA